jgi:hypothetical protein
VPQGRVTFQLFSETEQRILFARREQQRTAYLRPLQKLLVEVTQK